MTDTDTRAERYPDAHTDRGTRDGRAAGGGAPGPAPALRAARLELAGPAARPILLSAAPRLWTIDVEAESGAAWELAPDTLDAREWRRARRPGPRTGRAAYVCAHVGLRLLLGRHLGVPPVQPVLDHAPCPLCGGPHGRPVLAGGGPSFSLAYRPGLVLIGLATTTLGVDVEEIPGDLAAADVLTLLHPQERRAIRAAPSQERPLLVARTWTRKEALLKALGTGLGRGPDLDHVGALDAPARVPGFVLHDVDLGAAGAAGAGHAAALAVPEPLPAHRWPRRLSPR